MRISFRIFHFSKTLLVFATIFSASASALDCTIATTVIDKMICSSPKLKKADEEMSAAYFKLLRDTKDPQFHEALIRSQRRWLERRGEGPQRYGAAEDDKTDDRKILLKVTRDRLNSLKNAELIKALITQRATRVRDSGGPFAGYSVNCGIFPPPYGDWTYTCLATLHHQNGNRICSKATDWASGHITMIRRISTVRDGKIQPVASCSYGYAGTSAPCPGTGSNDEETKAGERWDMTAAEGRDSFRPSEKLWEYDADIDMDEDETKWMQACLFTAVYPPMDQRKDPPKNNPE